MEPEFKRSYILKILEKTMLAMLLLATCFFVFFATKSWLAVVAVLLILGCIMELFRQNRNRIIETILYSGPRS